MFKETFEKVVEAIVIFLIILTFFAGIYIFIDSRVYMLDKQDYFDSPSSPETSDLA